MQSLERNGPTVRTPLVTHASGCGSFFKIRIQSEQFAGKSIPGSSRLPLPDIHAHFILNIPRFGRVCLRSFFPFSVNPSVCSAAPAGEPAACRPRPAHSRIYRGNSKAFKVITKSRRCIARRVLLPRLPCGMRLWSMNVLMRWDKSIGKIWEARACVCMLHTNHNSHSLLKQHGGISVEGVAQNNSFIHQVD